MLGVDLDFPTTFGVVPVNKLVTDTVCLGRPAQLDLAPSHKIKRLPPDVCDRVGQVGATCVGPVFGPSFTCRQCCCNAVNALVNRHGAVPPVVTASFDDPGRHLEVFALHYLEASASYYDSWLSRWCALKQAAFALSAVFDSVKPDGVTAFVKREAGHALPTKARLIQGYCNLVTQETVAREQTCFQKALGAMFGPPGYEMFPGVFVTMGSGLTNQEVAAWARDSRARYRVPVYYERDGKNWDSTMQRPHHDYKIRWMRSVSGDLADFVDKSFVTNCVVRCRSGNLIYQLGGTVRSGHNDTTSGNSLINAAISAQVFHSLGLRASVIVLGDDMLAVVDGEFDLAAVVAAEASFGIKPEAAKFYDLGDVTFISACFLESTDGDVAFVPILGRQLTRLWWTTKPPPDRKLLDYRYSVSRGLASAVGELPIYRAFLAPTLGLQGRLIPIDKFKCSPHVGRVASGDYLPAMLRRYGLTIDEVMEFERFLCGLSGSAMVCHPVATKIIDRDLADVGARFPVAAPLD